MPRRALCARWLCHVRGPGTRGSTSLMQWEVAGVGTWSAFGWGHTRHVAPAASPRHGCCGDTGTPALAGNRGVTQPLLHPQSQGPSFSSHRAVTGTALKSPPDTQPALGTGPVAASVGRDAVSPGMHSPALGCHGGPTDPGCPCPQRGRAVAPGPSQAKSHPCLCRGAGGSGHGGGGAVTPLTLSPRPCAAWSTTSGSRRAASSACSATWSRTRRPAPPRRRPAPPRWPCRPGRTCRRWRSRRPSWTPRNRGASASGSCEAAVPRAPSQH